MSTVKTTNVWIQNYSKLDEKISLHELSFPNQFDIHKMTSLEQKENTTDEENEILHAERMKSIDIIRAYRNNQKLPPEVKPERLYTFSKLWNEKKGRVFPPLFMIANGYILATEAFATLLKQFNLGDTQLLPVNFYEFESDELFDDNTYYLLNICESHQYFLPEIEKEKLKNRLSCKKKNIYHAPNNKLQNQRYYFSKDALSCPVDLWYDPKIDSGFFMSDRLVKAIKKAGMKEILSILPCQFAE